jgi:hypothetical protein
MTPVEYPLGKSFKGLAAYLMHDKDKGESAERIAWAESHNLDGADPDKAWRLMAATAMSAEQLKEAAGIRKGKTASNTVYHFSLNFNPKDNPTEELQRMAVTDVLRTLKLDKYQALAVAHNDTKHSHVHVMVNLIDPETGLSAASKVDGKAALLSNTKRKLSTWAKAFEFKHGLTITEGRAANDDKRAQGEKVSCKRTPRNVFEQARGESKDRLNDFKKRTYDDKARQLGERGKTQREAHTQQWAEAKAEYQKEKDKRYREFQADRERRAKELYARQRKELADSYRRQRNEMWDFKREERYGLFRFFHAISFLRESAKKKKLLLGILCLISAAIRYQMLEERHKEEIQKIRSAAAARKAEENQAYYREYALGKEQARQGYLHRCKTLKATQDKERDELRQMWRAHNDERRKALVPAQRQTARPERERRPRRPRGQYRERSRTPE